MATPFSAICLYLTKSNGVISQHLYPGYICRQQSVSDTRKTVHVQILIDHRPIHLSVFSNKTGVLQWKTSLLEIDSLNGNKSLATMPDEDVTLGIKIKQLKRNCDVYKKS
jgi:hypothetical protein